MLGGPGRDEGGVMDVAALGCDLGVEEDVSGLPGVGGKVNN